MRKIFFLLSVVMVMLVLIPLAPIAASTPIDVSGDLYYTPYLAPDSEIKDAGGNQFLETIEYSRWEGSFVGVSFDECNVVIHRSGAWAYNAIAYFEGTVDGRTGELTLRLTGNRPDAFSDWEGQWVILGGTAGLANLHGQGTFEGAGSPGFGVEGSVKYMGQIHFDPAD
jgi:hypothetical protein